MVLDGASILSNAVVSQIDIFAEYGGVVPEVAARSHLEAILPVIDKALSDADCTWDDIDAIAVTHAPGLLGSLLIGTLTARVLAILHSKPLYAVHHLKSHVYANWLNTENQNDTFATRSRRPVVTGGASLVPSPLVGHGRESIHSDSPRFPLLALVVSGGHTQILYMKGHNQFEIIGTTRDDAVGECFDKVAKILGLPYPGGPSISKAALGLTESIFSSAGLEFLSTSYAGTPREPSLRDEPLGSVRNIRVKNSNQDMLQKKQISVKPGDSYRYSFPHPKVEGLDFSFSGLKTAVLREVQKEVGVPISYPSFKLKELLSPQQVCDFAASFQREAIEILAEKVEKAVLMYSDVQAVVVAGGVSANEELRKRLKNAYFPAPKLSGDNGAMVGAAAYYEIISGVEPTDPYALNIFPRISIEDQ